MSTPVLPTDATRDAAKAIGESFRPAYVSAEPYPHIQFDDFIEPAQLDAVLDDLGAIQASPSDSYNRDQERLKVGYHPDTLPERTRSLFRAFNAQPFIAFLEGLTGIKGLIPDPTFLGGGIHEVFNGGHLSIHADFNLHPQLHLERRINVLIYLNRDWQPSFGGQFEIWDTAMAQRHKAIDPLFNRCVVFNTTSSSYHGNPNPVEHPLGLSRRSIALYYYTATWDDTRRAHTTQFRRRPQTGDRADWRVRTKELAQDLMPPVLFRAVRRAVNALRE